MPLIPVEHLHPDLRNANHCNGETLAKIRGHIQRNQLCPTLIVRPHPTLSGQYMVIDGHHRLEIVKELGWEAVECQVFNIDDTAASVFLLTLNRLCGEDHPRKRAELMASLLTTVDIPTLAEWLPESPQEIEGLLALLHHDTEEQEARLRAQLEAERKSLPVPLGFLVSADDATFIQETLQIYRARGIQDQGTALVAICRDALAITEEKTVDE